MIAPHQDTAPYFAKTVRVHIPVATHESVWMVSDGQSYQMRLGEAWALNNSCAHAVWNDHDKLSRVHVICDFVPSSQLLELLRNSDRTLGQIRPDVDAHVQAALPPVAAAAG